jgi:mono/diheme cytochrome c family protein
VLVAACSSCTSAVPRVDASMAAAARSELSDVDPDLLRTGYDAYRARCAGCHHLVPPGDHPAEVWPGLVEEHRSRLDLSDAETRAITAYLQAGRLVHEGRVGR